jgi:hypothetical protein
MDQKAINLADRLALRPVVLPDDEDFLIRLCFTTRDDINFLPIDAEQKKSILLMQCQGQKQQYEAMPEKK